MSDNQGRGAHMGKTREGVPTGVTTREEERGVNSGPEHYRTPTHTPSPGPSVAPHAKAGRRDSVTVFIPLRAAADVNEARTVVSPSMNVALSRQPESPPRGGPVAQDELVAPEGHARLSCSN